MAPLIILITTFVLAALVNRYFFKNRFSLSQIGRLALAFMLIATGIAHFTKTSFMVEMMPAVIPFKTEVVYLTGILELIASVGLITQKYSKLIGIMLIIFFMALLPANIVGSMKKVALGGMAKGVSYLYFRIPLQIFFILWTYYFAVRKNKTVLN